MAIMPFVYAAGELPCTTKRKGLYQKLRQFSRLHEAHIDSGRTVVLAPGSSTESLSLQQREKFALLE